MLLDAGADPNVVRDRQYGFGGRYGAGGGSSPHAASTLANTVPRITFQSIIALASTSFG